ncbi:hypothetical protein TELCIR_14678 [Teladorsagia circumcincta]|uniref:Ig-like domain-containing protein n=1 Tax=Teladorsagia circumcincta TaxID=45464 RepID=A0A2G9U0B3_TELCI|nr:hypothetical protein TELCIR_14678 [Teladorsagia circumcincta]
MHMSKYSAECTAAWYAVKTKNACRHEAGGAWHVADHFAIQQRRWCAGRVVMTSLETNLADLNLKTSQLLSNCLTSGDLWLKIVDTNRNSIYYMSEDEVERVGREANPEPLRWAKADEIVVSIIPDNNTVRLQCTAVGFPSPRYHWYKNDEHIEAVSSHVIDVVRCKCSSEFTFYCVATNEVEDGYVYSEFYRKPGKEYSSRIVSRTISMEPFVGQEQRCESCRNGELENLREIMASMNTSALERPPEPPEADYHDELLVAADKVALIISNCMYQHLPKLVTPLCDAETLATALQDLKYKTVTLADLTLVEMKYLIKEYKRYEYVPAFVEYAEPFKMKHKPSRNTVYGYSTSGGVGAYEGELNCRILLTSAADKQKVVAIRDVVLGHVLITRIEMIK